MLTEKVLTAEPPWTDAPNPQPDDSKGPQRFRDQNEQVLQIREILWKRLNSLETGMILGRHGLSQNICEDWEHDA